jgi:hypothetical protein
MGVALPAGQGDGMLPAGHGDELLPAGEGDNKDVGRASAEKAAGKDQQRNREIASPLRTESKSVPP